MKSEAVLSDLVAPCGDATARETELPRFPLTIADVHAEIRKAGGIVHGDGNIFFTRAEQFVAAAVLIGEAPSARDADRLRYVMTDIDGFVGIEADRHDFASQVALERGHDEPTQADELEGLRRLIDVAIELRGRE